MENEELAAKLSAWIKEKIKSAGLKGAVFGLSGGVDSSVVAALSRRAVGDNTLGLIMPCHSDPQDAADAMSAAVALSIKTKKVDLAPIYNGLIGVFTGEGAGPFSRLALGNLKARLRMLTLYFHANELGYMVVGSGNRSELAVGYFTKYGDGGVDILPLGNLVKKQVRVLAAYLGVPQQIIDKPPSAGLWHGQTDEGELGCRYEELDRHLLGGKVPDDTRRLIEKMAIASKHKRELPPIPDF
jgi:NAD+ synthase